MTACEQHDFYKVQRSYFYTCTALPLMHISQFHDFFNINHSYFTVVVGTIACVWTTAIADDPHSQVEPLVRGNVCLLYICVFIFTGTQITMHTYAIKNKLNGVACCKYFWWHHEGSQSDHSYGHALTAAYQHTIEVQTQLRAAKKHAARNAVCCGALVKTNNVFL